MGSDLVQSQNNKPRILVKEFLWANPQKAIFTVADNEKSLLQIFSKENRVLDELINRNEIEAKYMPSIYIVGTNNTVEKKLMDQFKLEAKIPADYFVAGNAADNFIWLRRETKAISSNIVIYNHVNSSAFSGDSIKAFINLAGKHISSASEGSYFEADSALALTVSAENKGYSRVFKACGLWNMRNDFMGGPFVSRIYYDEKSRRIILLLGFVYAPGEKKRVLIKQIKTILDNVQFPKS